MSRLLLGLNVFAVCWRSDEPFVDSCNYDICSVGENIAFWRCKWTPYGPGDDHRRRNNRFRTISNLI